MTRRKRIFSFVLVMLMVISLLPTFALADGSGSGAEQPVWPNEGSIKLDKDAQAVAGQDNLWEVTLGIQGKNYTTTSDVVLVIDCSGSMDGSKLANTRAAAKAFGDKLLTEGSTTRIAIVTFIDTATAYNNGHFYTASELSDFKTAVEQATYADGGTNQQAGIHVAQQLLASAQSTGKLKNIVLLSDGAPTYSYRLTGTATWTGCYNNNNIIGHQWGNWISGGKVDSSTISVTGCSYELVGTGYDQNSNKGKIDLTVTCEHGNSRNDTEDIDHSVATIWEANTAKAAGTTIFSVALQAGTNGEATLKSCATDSTKGYFAIGSNDNVETKLTDAFTAIAGSIAIAATNGSVADTMGDHVALSFSGSAPVITTDKAVYDAGNADVYISQGSATYDAAGNGTIHWTVGNVSEGDNPTLKYKVKVKDGYNPPTGEVLDANQQATFSYTNYLGQETESAFPVPKVTVGGGTILVHYYLVNGDGQPINQDGVVVDDPSLAQQVKTAEYFSVDGTTGLKYNTLYTVNYETISGYTYSGQYILNQGTPATGDAASVKLTAANSNQHVWFAYTQSFTVAHVQNGTVVATETLPVQNDFNLTAKVPAGYLYGGAFTDEACDADHVQTFASGENALDFTPEAGETYYIWEVDQKYLAPKTFCTWYTNGDSQREVVGLYLMTPLDRTLYSEAGFTMGGVDYPSKDAAGNLIAYQDITVAYGKNPNRTDLLYLQNGVMKQKTYYDKATDSIKKDDGYIAVYPLTSDQFAAFKNAPFTFQPYWITLDGVKVTGFNQRTCTYNPAPSERIGVNDQGVGTKVTAAGTTAQAAPMVFAATYTLVADQGPTAENTVTIQVNDNGNRYDVTANCGDVTGQITYAGAAGKVFAGWYTDEACTAPADLTNVQEDLTVYAKYVSDSYLRVKYTQTGLFRVRSVSLVAAVDPGTDYAGSGFIINGKEVSATDYSSRYGLLRAQTLFGRGVDKNALLMTTQYALSGMSYGDTLEITPYWVTPDGTTVTGETRTLTYSRFGLKG